VIGGPFGIEGIDTKTRNRRPRQDRTASIPGFDYQPGPHDTLGSVVVAEALNTDFAGGRATRLTCTTANGYIYRVDVLDGETAFVYLGVIDRSPPLQVTNNGERCAVLISGLSTPTAPDISDVSPMPTPWSGTHSRDHEATAQPDSR